MSKNPDPKDHRESFRRLDEVRAQAVEHTRLAQQFHRERRGIITGLIDAGFSQADLARELGVSRQAIQKMLSTWRSTGRAPDSGSRRRSVGR